MKFYDIFEADDFDLVQAVFNYLKRGFPSKIMGESIKVVSKNNRAIFILQLEAENHEQIVRSTLSANSYASGWLEQKLLQNPLLKKIANILENKKGEN